MRSMIRLVLAAGLGCAVGCGGGSNNDQGTSFTFLGWNSVDTTTGACNPETFIDAITVPLSSITEGTSSDPGVFTCSLAQNEICTQGIRVDRVLMRYDVAGASVQVPNTTIPMGAVLGPQTCVDTSIASSLPQGFRNVAPQRGITVNTLPTQIREFLSTNRSDLPEAPYTINACATLSGVTTSGQRMNSNELCLNVVIAPDDVISPTTGSTGTTSGSEIDESITTDVDVSDTTQEDTIGSDAAI